MLISKKSKMKCEKCNKEILDYIEGYNICKECIINAIAEMDREEIYICKSCGQVSPYCQCYIDLKESEYIE